MSAERQIGPDTIVVRNEEPIAVEMDRTVVMMSVQQGMYFGLEGVGPRIWALLDRPRPVSQICGELTREFEVDGSDCLRDVCEFLEELRRADLVRVHDESTGPVRAAGGR